MCVHMEATWRTAWIILLRFDSIKWNIMWFLEWIFVLNLAEISIFILNHRSPLSIDSDTCLATFLLPIYGIIFETAAGSTWIQEYAYVLAHPRILFVSSHMEHDLNASMNNNFAYVFHWGNNKEIKFVVSKGLPCLCEKTAMIFYWGFYRALSLLSTI